MQFTKEGYNNHLKITGMALSQPTYTHTVKTGGGEIRYCEFFLLNERLSHAQDTILVSVKEELIKEIDFTKKLEIIGEVRTANIEAKTSKRSFLKMYAFVTEISNCEPYNTNEFEAIVYLCREPKHRKTPNGKTITDLTLACIRPYKNRSDYFPCITWGDQALEAKELKIGQKLCIKGRFQSRDYIKKIDNKEVKRTAWEISIKQFEVLE